jgi:superfamily I DNA/RNA helicase
VNPEGESFDSDLDELRSLLSDLTNDDRKAYRNGNATAIATLEHQRLLIVAGPGSGKSHLFLSRIRYWLPLDNGSRIYVSSFVRKLVRDLQADVEHQLDLSEQQRVTVTTLHGLARSIVERSRGTTDQPMQQHINLIANGWANVVWADVREFHSGLQSGHSLRRLEAQFHTERVLADEQWVQLRETYAELCMFYNAMGFADMVVLARQAVDERPQLVEHDMWIIDEYQDFNAAENHLVQSLTTNASGVLIAGDDEQALYQQLKSSHPDIIISYYTDTSFANAMLPYCSRCSYHVCLAASAFIDAGRLPSSIKKIYLPLEVDESAPKVRLVATSAPTSAVSYIKKFISDHQAELDAYIEKMQAGEETDSFLLILTPQKAVSFYGGAVAELKDWLSQWSVIDTGRSSDYKRVATYYRVGGNPAGNFAFRKVLDYEGATPAEVHPFIEAAMQSGVPLSAVAGQIVSSGVDKCTDVAGLIDDESLAVDDLVTALQNLVEIDEPAALVQEIEAHPLSGGLFTSDDEADEAIETAGAAAPVQLLTMVGSKGLSAQHVIVIGCDNVNMSKTTRLTFFVALTRARQSLHLVTSLKSRGSSAAHQFVGELPAGACDFLVFKKTGSVTEELSGPSAWNGKMATWARAARRGPS